MFSWKQKEYPAVDVDYTHPEDEDMDTYDELYEEQNACESYSCDTCDKDFDSIFYYEKHMSEHKTCNLDGCQFTAHEKIIEKHIRMQHTTGLYDKIRNINTPEDIAKWVEDRKKRYPSKENIEMRRQQQELRLKRGERIKRNENKFGRNNHRLTKANTKNRPVLKSMRKKLPPKQKKVSLIDEKVDWNGSMFPFKGISNLLSETEETQDSDYDDEEWKTNLPNNTIKLNNSLGALMGAYMSDYSDDEVSTEVPTVTVSTIAPTCGAKTENINNSNNCITNSPENDDDDDEPPTELKIVKLPIEQISECSLITSETSFFKNNTDKSKVNYRIRNRNKKIGKNAVNRKNIKNKNITRYHKQNPKNDFPYRFKKRKVTLLEKLLEKEIVEERNKILQCVRYVLSNNFFQ